MFLQIQFGVQLLRLALEVGDARPHVLGTPIILDEAGRPAGAKVADLPSDRLEPRADGGLQQRQIRGPADFVGEFPDMQHHRVVDRLGIVEAAAG
jgi:hypothetical protein